MRLPALNEQAGWRYFTFFYLYLMQGIPAGFALTAIANYLVGKGLASQQVGSFVAIVGIPWILQFVWGPLIDRYQYSVIGHRKHWVLLTQLVAFLASLTLLLVQQPEKQLVLMSVVFFTHSIFASIQDASVDAIAIFIVPEQERGRVNAFMRGGFLLGIAFGSAVLSTVLHRWGFTTAVWVQSLSLLLFTILTFFIKLDQHDPLLPSKATAKRPLNEGAHNPSLSHLFRELFRGMTVAPSLRSFGVIALVYLCLSIFIRSFSYHIIHVLKWPDQEVSVLQGSWGSLLTFCVIVGGGVLSDRVGARRLQIWVMWSIGLFLLVLCSLSFLWVHREVTTSGLILWNFVDPLFSVACFPILMSLCRPLVEGSQFTAYMAFINFCDVIGSYVSGWALNWVKAPLLGLLCAGLILGSVIALQVMRSRRLSLADA
ncbi:MAG: MFS transporter [Williamsia sp.]|nr:MFS transporter [Williamsia sp.]